MWHWSSIFYVALCANVCYISSYDPAPFESNSDSYPTTIPAYPIRRDVYTNEEVTTGRLDLIGGLAKQQVSIEYFRRSLQCRTKRQYVRESNGIWQFLKNVPPTSDLVKLLCAWCETDSQWASLRDWKPLRKKAVELSKTNFTGKTVAPGAAGSPYQVRLMRVINGSLYQDWPWGAERFHNELVANGPAFLLMLVLEKIGQSLGDSAFFLGQEMSAADIRFPFPIFSNSPQVHHGDLVIPWNYEIRMELDMYDTHKRNGAAHHRKYAEANTVPWEQKEDKACFFGTTHSVRQYALDMAIMRPDLMDAGYTSLTHNLVPWNPLSNESEASHHNIEERRKEAMMSGEPPETRPGFIGSYYRFKLERGVHYMHKYKYILVVAGLNGMATADRLASTLAYSGAVVLLQDPTPHYYHFSYHLKPWVHYVPIAYNLADLIDKIEWLKQNGNLARQIVANAQAFAKSHLRLEDYFCFVANALETMSDHVNGTSAAEPFSPVPMRRRE
jgi:hypothetical protein